MATRFEILDATLREGEQKAGVRFSAEQKVKILHLLEDFGIRLVEAGHPAISKEDERICQEVVDSSRTAEILLHARASRSEVRVVAKTGAPWVGIWSSINDLAMATKFLGRSVEDILEKVRCAVAEAKDNGLSVRFTIEDASRTPWERISLAASTALEAGADRISFADTVGVLEPKSCGRLVSRAVDEFGCDVEVHCHNDLGLALANTLAALDAGASVVDASVLGIGERVGITDLLQLGVVLTELRGEQRLALESTPALADAVSKASGYRPDELRPVIGRDAFTHTSAYHVQAVERDPSAYEPFRPERVGRHRRLENGRPPVPAAPALRAIS
jgi:2-isopropylmalate synthase